MKETDSCLPVAGSIARAPGGRHTLHSPLPFLETWPALKWPLPCSWEEDGGIWFVFMTSSVNLIDFFKILINTKF